MAQTEFMTVIDRDGLTGLLVETKDVEALVRLESGETVAVPINVMVIEDDGNYHVPGAFGDFKAQSGARIREVDDSTQVLPVAQEELRVDKRRVATGGVRIKKVVHEREELIDEPLLKEEVNVERVSINRVVDDVVPIRYEGDTTIVSLFEEVLVVERRLMLKEELHITKRQFEAREPQRVTLRSEEAVIERLDGTADAGSSEEDKTM